MAEFDLAIIGGAAAGPYFIAAFLASLVEFVEAMTITPGVRTTRGWRPRPLRAPPWALPLLGLSWLLGPADSRLAAPSRGSSPFGPARPLARS